MNIRQIVISIFLLFGLGTSSPQMNASNSNITPMIFAALIFWPMMQPAVQACINDLKIAVYRMQKVGVVTIVGTITHSAKTVRQLQAFFEDASIKAIVIKIDSGGGAPGASQAIYHIITELKKAYNKPVIVWIENIAASGAYYIAAAADLIIAAPSALVGSVGVIAPVMQYREFLKRYGAEPKILTAGKYKAGSHPFNDMTDAQQQMIQDVLTSTYERFIADVQRCRVQLATIPPKQWANGRFFDADKGLALGLVDRVGSQLTVEEAVKELTGTQSSIFWVYPPKKASTALIQFGSQSEEDDVEGSSYIAMLIDVIYNKIAQRLQESNQLRTQL